MTEANESKRMEMSVYERDTDKRTFLKNLAWLLRQTREDVNDIVLITNTALGEEFARVMCVSGRGEEYYFDVNIHADSYTAIVLDVVKAVLYG